MKQRGLVILGIALGLFFVTASGYAAEKLAYVDFGQLFSQYSKTKEYDKVLEKKQKDYEEKREKKLEDVKKMQEKLSLLSEDERESRKNKLEDKIVKLQEFDRNATQDLRKERDKSAQDIFKDIQGVIESYAKEKDLTFVFDKRALVYEKKDLDITKEISEILNKK